MRWNRRRAGGPRGGVGGVAFVAVLVGSSPATAEIPLAQYHGWQLSVDGRVNAFLSVAEGDGLPDQEPAVPGAGTVDAKNSAGALHSTRIRDGFLTSIFGVTGSKEVAKDFKVTGRVGLWMNIAAGRYQNIPGLVDPRRNRPFTIAAWRARRTLRWPLA